MMAGFRHLEPTSLSLTPFSLKHSVTEPLALSLGAQHAEIANACNYLTGKLDMEAQSVLQDLPNGSYRQGRQDAPQWCVYDPPIPIQMSNVRMFFLIHLLVTFERKGEFSEDQHCLLDRYIPKHVHSACSTVG